MANPITRVWRRFRSAITGRYVTKRYAEQHPDTTIAERATPPKSSGD